jgi:O-antigen/teichoic acid export membrane protein
MATTSVAARRFLSTSTSVVAARVLGACVGFGTQILLARLLSPDAVGRFFLVSGAAAVIGTAAASGYPTLANRFVARYRDGAPELLLGLVRRMRRDTARLALAVAVPLALLGLAWPWADRDMRLAVAAGTLSIPAIALLRIHGGLANAVREFELCFLPDLLYRPILLLVLIGGAWLAGIELSAATVVLLLSVVTVTVAFVQYVWLRPHLPPARAAIAPDPRLVARWRATARPLLLVALVTGLFADVDVVIAGTLMPAHQLAVFGVCLKIAFLVGFAVQVVHSIAGPDLADGWVRRDGRLLGSAVARANQLSVGVTLLATAATALGGVRLLAAFGPDYVAGQGALVVLVFAQLVRAAFGPNVAVLTLRGAQARMAAVFGASLLVLIAANVALTPAYGILGAALAVLVTVAFLNVALAVLLRRTTGVRSDVAASFLGRPAAGTGPWRGRPRVAAARAARIDPVLGGGQAG